MTSSSCVRSVWRATRTPSHWRVFIPSARTALRITSRRNPRTRSTLCCIHIHVYQGCGLGLDVSVSRRTNVSSREKLSTPRSRLGLGHLRLLPKTNFRPNCAGHSMQCERALDVVSLCCSFYIAHHINMLKTINVKDNI